MIGADAAQLLSVTIREPFFTCLIEQNSMQISNKPLSLQQDAADFDVPIPFSFTSENVDFDVPLPFSFTGDNVETSSSLEYL